MSATTPLRRRDQQAPAAASPLRSFLSGMNPFASARESGAQIASQFAGVLAGVGVDALPDLRRLHGLVKSYASDLLDKKTPSCREELARRLRELIGTPQFFFRDTKPEDFTGSDLDAVEFQTIFREFQGQISRVESGEIDLDTFSRTFYGRIHNWYLQQLSPVAAMAEVTFDRLSERLAPLVRMDANLPSTNLLNLRELIGEYYRRVKLGRNTPTDDEGIATRLAEFLGHMDQFLKPHTLEAIRAQEDTIQPLRECLQQIQDNKPILGVVSQAKDLICNIYFGELPPGAAQIDNICRVAIGHADRWVDYVHSLLPHRDGASMTEGRPLPPDYIQQLIDEASPHAETLAAADSEDTRTKHTVSQKRATLIQDLIRKKEDRLRELTAIDNLTHAESVEKALLQTQVTTLRVQYAQACHSIFSVDDVVMESAPDTAVETASPVDTLEAQIKSADIFIEVERDVLIQNASQYLSALLTLSVAGITGDSSIESGNLHTPALRLVQTSNDSASFKEQLYKELDDAQINFARRWAAKTFYYLFSNMIHFYVQNFISKITDFFVKKIQEGSQDNFATTLDALLDLLNSEMTDAIEKFTIMAKEFLGLIPSPGEGRPSGTFAKRVQELYSRPNRMRPTRERIAKDFANAFLQTFTSEINWRERVGLFLGQIRVSRQSRLFFINFPLALMTKSVSILCNIALYPFEKLWNLGVKLVLKYYLINSISSMRTSVSQSLFGGVYTYAFDQYTQRQLKAVLSGMNSPKAAPDSSDGDVAEDDTGGGVRRPDLALGPDISLQAITTDIPDKSIPAVSESIHRRVAELVFKLQGLASRQKALTAQEILKLDEENPSMLNSVIQLLRIFGVEADVRRIATAASVEKLTTLIQDVSQELPLKHLLGMSLHSLNDSSFRLPDVITEASMRKTEGENRKLLDDIIRKAVENAIRDMTDKYQRIQERADQFITEFKAETGRLISLIQSGEVDRDTYRTELTRLQSLKASYVQRSQVSGAIEDEITRLTNGHAQILHKTQATAADNAAIAGELSQFLILIEPIIVKEQYYLRAVERFSQDRFGRSLSEVVLGVLQEAVLGQVKQIPDLMKGDYSFIADELFGGLLEWFAKGDSR
jgi:hypothetical protein